MLERTLLTANVVYNGLGTPRQKGAMVIQNVQGEEKIIAIDDLATAKLNFPNLEPKHVGLALSPKPANAHMHLDLTSMPYFQGSYERFITEVIKHSASAKRNLDAVKQAVQDLKRQGINVIGDIVSQEDVMTYLLNSDLQGVAYWQVIDPNPESSEQTFNKTVEQLRTFKKLEREGGMRVGLSPHTPHTVSAPLLEKLARLAKQNNLPMQIHVAESPSEKQLYETGQGDLRDFMGDALSHWNESNTTPIQYLNKLGVLEARPSLVHMVQVTEEDIKTVQKAGCTVIHCPRSNQTLNCGRFPIESYAKHGVSLALGTDASSSSGSLDLQDELRAALEIHGDKASLQGLIWAAVKGGYRALNMKPPQIVRGDSAEKLFIWNAATGL